MTETDYPVTTTDKRNIWLRGLFMLVMAMAYQLSGTLLFILAVIQFVLVLINETPNVRLLAFGASLGSYTRQIVRFMTFSSEDIPFPFSDWPSAK
jgi:hypothetical protein